MRVLCNPEFVMSIAQDRIHNILYFAPRPPVDQPTPTTIPAPMLHTLMGLLLGLRTYDVGMIPLNAGDQIDISDANTWRYGVYLYTDTTQDTPLSWVRFGSYKNEQGTSLIGGQVYRQIPAPQAGRTVADSRLALSIAWESRRKNLEGSGTYEQGVELALDGLLLDMWDLQDAVEHGALDLPGVSGDYVTIPGSMPLLASDSGSRPSFNAPFVAIAVQDATTSYMALIGTDGRSTQVSSTDYGAVEMFATELPNFLETPIAAVVSGQVSISSAPRAFLHYNDGTSQWESFMTYYETDLGQTKWTTLTNAQVVYRLTKVRELVASASAVACLAQYRQTVDFIGTVIGSQTGNILNAVMPALANCLTSTQWKTDPQATAQTNLIVSAIGSCLTSAQWKNDTTPTKQTTAILSAIQALPAPESPDLKPLYANVRANDSVIIAMLACIYGSQLGHGSLEQVIKLLERVKIEPTDEPIPGETLANSGASPLVTLFNHITPSGVLK